MKRNKEDGKSDAGVVPEHVMQLCKSVSDIQLVSKLKKKGKHHSIDMVTAINQAASELSLPGFPRTDTHEILLRVAPFLMLSQQANQTSPLDAAKSLHEQSEEQNSLQSCSEQNTDDIKSTASNTGVPVHQKSSCQNYSSCSDYDEVSPSLLKPELSQSMQLLPPWPKESCERTHSKRLGVGIENSVQEELADQPKNKHLPSAATNPDKSSQERRRVSDTRSVHLQHSPQGTERRIVHSVSPVMLHPPKWERMRFTALQEEALVYGVMKYGRGSWKKISEDGWFDGRRTSELSDKYRNLEKYGHLPKVKQRVREMLSAGVNPLKELRAVVDQQRLQRATSPVADELLHCKQSSMSQPKELRGTLPLCGPPDEDSSTTSSDDAFAELSQKQARTGGAVALPKTVCSSPCRQSTSHTHSSPQSRPNSSSKTDVGELADQPKNKHLPSAATNPDKSSQERRHVSDTRSVHLQHSPQGTERRIVHSVSPVMLHPPKWERMRFTALQEEALVYGVMKYGRGSWKKISEDGWFDGRRTSELSDKYRNLEKYGHLPKVKQRVREMLSAGVNPLKELRAVVDQQRQQRATSPVADELLHCKQSSMSQPKELRGTLPLCGPPDEDSSTTLSDDAFAELSQKQARTGGAVALPKTVCSSPCRQSTSHTHSSPQTRPNSSSKTDVGELADQPKNKHLPSAATNPDKSSQERRRVSDTRSVHLQHSPQGTERRIVHSVSPVMLHPPKWERMRFTALQEEALVYGVMKYGRGSWKKISEDGWFDGRRTSELSDKYRNLEKYGHLPKVKQRVREMLSAGVNPLKELRAVVDQQRLQRATSPVADELLHCKQSSMSQPKELRGTLPLCGPPDEDSSTTSSDDAFAELSQKQARTGGAVALPKTVCSSPCRQSTSHTHSSPQSRPNSSSKTDVGELADQPKNKHLPSAATNPDKSSQERRHVSDTRSVHLQHSPQGTERRIVHSVSPVLLHPPKWERMRFTALQEEALVYGVMKYGRGSWKKISEDGWFDGRRTSELSDKYRNLEKYGHLPKVKRRVREMLSAGVNPLKELRAVVDQQRLQRATSPVADELLHCKQSSMSQPKELRGTLPLCGPPDEDSSTTSSDDAFAELSQKQARTGGAVALPKTVCSSPCRQSTSHTHSSPQSRPNSSSKTDVGELANQLKNKHLPSAATNPDKSSQERRRVSDTRSVHLQHSPQGTERRIVHSVSPVMLHPPKWERMQFTALQEEALVYGVMKYGRGSWKKISEDGWFDGRRTSELSDKYRNLEKYGHLPKVKRRVREMLSAGVNPLKELRAVVDQQRLQRATSPVADELLHCKQSSMSQPKELRGTLPLCGPPDEDSSITSSDDAFAELSQKQARTGGAVALPKTVCSSPCRQSTSHAHSSPQSRPNSSSKTDVSQEVVPVKYKKKQRRVPFTPLEEQALVAGVMKFGKGNWLRIARQGGFLGRTSTQLSDKYRNLTLYHQFDEIKRIVKSKLERGEDPLEKLRRLSAAHWKR